MYQTGDLLWIPAGTLLKRPRVLGRDDLFSNFYQTKQPEIALFICFQSSSNCGILLDGKEWLVETKDIRHNVQEKTC